MNGYDCEAIRDLLPSLLRDELTRDEAAAARRHLAACSGCRDELEIVELLQTSLAPVPPGLESKVLRAVRHSPIRTGRSPARFAIAATIAATVIGAPFVYQRAQQMAAPASDLSVLSWAAAEDPMLNGHSDVHDLSVEDLELLLTELEP